MKHLFFLWFFASYVSRLIKLSFFPLIGLIILSCGDNRSNDISKDVSSPPPVNEITIRSDEATANSNEVAVTPSETTISPNEVAFSPNEVTTSLNGVAFSSSEVTNNPNEVTVSPSETTTSSSETTVSPNETTASSNEAANSPNEITTNSNEAAISFGATPHIVTPTPKIMGIQLVRKNTLDVLQNVEQGSVVDLNDLPPSFNFLIIPESTYVTESIAIKMTGCETVSRTENSAPYTVAYQGIGFSELSTGNCTITATPYQNANLTGETGDIFTITFTVIDTAEKNSSDVTPGIDSTENIYQSKEYLSLADVMVDFQRPVGGWGKLHSYEDYVDTNGQIDTTLLTMALEKNSTDAETYDDKNTVYRVHSHRASGFDNDSTTTELLFLMQIIQSASGTTVDTSPYKQALEAGLTYILEAQYDSGGWPQNFPNLGSYGGYITFNDMVIPNILLTIEEVLATDFSWMSSELKTRLKNAHTRAIDYILDTQISLNGIKTAWAQHYLNTPGLSNTPAQGRIYEPPAIATLESREVVRALMRIQNPSNQVKHAVTSAMEWFGSIEIDDHIWTTTPVPTTWVGTSVTNLYTTYNEDPASGIEKIYVCIYDDKDKILEYQPNSGVKAWARFYSLHNQKPVFSDFSGREFNDVQDINYCRRKGYAWYGNWLASMLQYSWPSWKAKYIDEPL